MYINSNGVKIYYEVSGAGFPFVMIHANPFDHNLWMYQIARFSTYFKIIAVDIRGYGRSDKPETPFSLEDMADDVLGVCRDEEIKEAIVGGTDMTPRLGTMKVPTLVINGAYDNSLKGGQLTASLIPGAVHKILPETGHACNIEDPAGFDEFVIEFLKSLNLMPAKPSR